MKKFLTKISYTVLPLWLLFVGLAVYLSITGDKSGDLMRLGLIDSPPEYTDSILACENILPEVYYSGISKDSTLRADTIDVLVIGDSFTHGGGVGKQGTYVNYLAHDSGRQVAVFSPRDPRLSSPMQVAYDVLKSGLVDSSHVRNLVVQEVERYIVSRHYGFSTDHEVDFSEPDAVVVAAEEPAAKQETSPLLRVKDYLFYRFFGANPIYKVKLSQPVFGGTEPDVLYFYNDDVKMGIGLNDEERNRLVSCYRQLIEMAREKGVNLVLLVACDKYDLYQDWIVDNPYPPKTLNEDIAQWMAPDTANFIFAKQVLHPLIEQGVKDVYLFNDTHWSPASSRVIAAEVINKLK